MLTELLKQKKSAFHERWLRGVISTYPADAAGLLGRRNDRFGNPVGHTLQTATAEIVDRFLDNAAIEEFQRPLEEILRMRSVQDFTASGAVEFVFLLKTAVRDMLTPEERASLATDDLERCDHRIDRLALAAFDIFMMCREHMYQIRANELRNRTHLLLERTGYFSNGSTG